MLKKRLFIIMTFIVGIMLVCSCVSLTDREMTAEDRENANIIGNISTEFKSNSFYGFYSKKSIKNKAYRDLMNIAQQMHGDNVDVNNIVIKEKANFLRVIGAIWAPMSLSATGDVIAFDSETGVTRINQSKLDNAINRVSQTFIENLPGNSIIAILNVEYEDDPSHAQYTVEEIEFMLFGSKKFKIADRRHLDQIFDEQNFHLSGHVDDDSAVSIGKMLGANIIITGNISSLDDSKRIYLSAIDVQTGQIITIAREQL